MEDIESLAQRINEAYRLHGAVIKDGLREAENIGQMLLRAKKQLSGAEFAIWAKESLIVEPEVVRHCISVVAGRSFIGDRVEPSKAIAYARERTSKSGIRNIPAETRDRDFSWQESAKAASDGDLVDAIVEMLADRDNRLQILERVSVRIAAMLSSKRHSFRRAE